MGVLPERAGDGRWFAEYIGSSTDFAAVSGLIRVHVISAAATRVIGAAALNQLGLARAGGLLPGSS